MRCRIEACVLTLLVALATVVTAQDGTRPRERRARARATTAFGKLPLYFVENRGVYDAAVRYYIQGRDKTLYFTDRGVTFSLRGNDKAWTTKLDFVGGNPDARPEGRDKQPAVFSYFKGPEKDWKAGLPSFASIVYRDLWPGIDLVYNGTVNRLKYEFVVGPGADPKKIRLRYRGVEKLERTDAGAFKVTTPGGSFEDAPPVAWQEIDGERVPVAMAYAVGEDGAFGFEVGEYDATRPLVLDPAVIVYCGYIGGIADDWGMGAAVDPAGNMYVGGYPWLGTNFPVKVGPDLTPNGKVDVFVAKIRADGSGLDYCGYIGGTGDDYGAGIAVDGAGCAYVVGWTWSPESSFPVVVGPGLRHSGGGADAFIAKVNAKGTGLDYCGYIGGSSGAGAEGVAVDAQGRAYVSGRTASDERTFPVTVGPDLTYNGGGDAWIARVSAQGAKLEYCGYVGGSAGEHSHGLAVDAAGCAYLTGSTGSTEATFPVKVGPDLTYNGGVDDCYIAKVNAQGTALVYCGYIGGSSVDIGSCVAVDATGRAYVGGHVESTETSFPVHVGPDLTYNGGSSDGFIASVAANGGSLVYCGYVGGGKGETVRSVAVDGSGHAYVSGTTDSDERTFPVKVGPDLTHDGNGDAYVAKVNAQGTALVYCGYIGGIGVEIVGVVAVDHSGNAYVGGLTTSDERSFPVKVGPDLTYNGAGDTFVAKVALTLLEASGTPRPGGTVNFTLTATDDVGVAYQLGSSLGTGPILIGGRALGLSPDPLLVATVNNYLPATFVNYAGLIAANGTATARINIPNGSFLVGQRFHTAFVTLKPSAPQGIKSISNTCSFQVTP